MSTSATNTATIQPALSLVRGDAGSDAGDDNHNGEDVTAVRNDDNDREERRSGEDRRHRAEQDYRVFTPQFVWQIVTWLFMQIIAAAVVYNVFSTRLTTVEVKMTQMSNAIDSVSADKRMLDARLIVVEKAIAKQEAKGDLKDQEELLAAIRKLMSEKKGN